MMFTIGHTESYEQGILEFGDDFKKLGLSKEYKGGIAFLTIEEASKYASLYKGFSIYGLDTTRDNTYVADGNLHLVNSCRILKLNN